MKKIFSILFFGALCAFIPKANAQPGESVRQYDTIRNWAVNPGFEFSKNGVDDGSSIATINTNSANYRSGKASLKIDSTSAGQTVSIKGNNNPYYHYGQPWAVSCWVFKPSGTSTYKMGMSWNQGSTKQVEITPTLNDNTWTLVRTTMPSPMSGSDPTWITFTSVASNEPAIYVDDCTISQDTNIGTVSQAQLVGGVVVTGCASNWATTSATYASQGTQTGCTYTTFGQALAPATNIAGFKFASLPPGEYAIEYEGRIGINTSGIAFYKFNDGTNDARETSMVDVNASSASPGIKQTITYTAPQSNIQFELKAKSSSGNSTYTLGTTTYPGTFRLWWFPSSSTSVSLNQANYDWTSYTPSSTQGLGTPSSYDCKHKRDGSDVLLNCKLTSGTVTASEMRIALPDGLTSADTNTIASIKGVGNLYRSSANAHAVYTLIEPSKTYVTFGAQSGTQAALTKLNANSVVGSSETFSFEARVPVSGWTNTASVYIPGSLVSGSAGIERTERAVIVNNGSTCTASTTSSSWLSSITRNATGKCTLNFASGTFSAAPTCTATVYDANRFVNGGNGAPTTSSYQVHTGWDLSSYGDTTFGVICTGPK